MNCKRLYNGPNMPAPHSLSPRVHTEKGNAGLAARLSLHKRLWVSLLYYEGMLYAASCCRRLLLVPCGLDPAEQWLQARGSYHSPGCLPSQCQLRQDGHNGWSDATLCQRGTLGGSSREVGGGRESQDHHETGWRESLLTRALPALTGSSTGMLTFSSTCIHVFIVSESFCFKRVINRFRIRFKKRFVVNEGNYNQRRNFKVRASPSVVWNCGTAWTRVQNCAWILVHWNVTTNNHLWTVPKDCIPNVTFYFIWEGFYLVPCVHFIAMPHYWLNMKDFVFAHMF